MQHSPWRFCIAPMMDWSDRHCRYFWRLLSRNARLYTEMVTTGALVHGDRNRFLKFHPAEHPLALQLGGSDPKSLAECAKMAEDTGFDEINLNCGCPSDRVQNGKIGACLMAEPELVAECVHRMQASVSIPITLKHRIGIDHHDSWEALDTFVSHNFNAGCRVFIVHARKAWLQGLSPKQNREIPPLDYPRVYALAKAYPEATIVINGGVTQLEEAATHLLHVHGVMMGREAYHNPYRLAAVDTQLFGGLHPSPSREEVLADYIEYCEHELHAGNKLHRMSRHILGLYLNQPGGKKFRRHISENATLPDADTRVLANAAEWTRGYPKPQ